MHEKLKIPHCDWLLHIKVFNLIMRMSKQISISTQEQLLTSVEKKDSLWSTFFNFSILVTPT